MNNNETRELVLQLLDDIETLEKQFKCGDPSPSESRTVLIPILRKWIIDDNFSSIQKLIDKNMHPSFIIIQNDGLKLCEDGYYEYWIEQLNFNQASISSGRVARKYIKDNKVLAPNRRSQTVIKSIPQKSRIFFNQKIMFWEKIFYTRSDFIKWHANKLGGIHYDFKRKINEGHINAIKNAFGFEVNGNNYQILLGNDIEVGRANIHRRQHIYDTIELVAIDTARVFLEGIDKAKPVILALLSEIPV